MNEIELRAELRRLLAELGAAMTHAGANTVVVARLTGARTLLQSAHDVIKVPAVIRETEDERIEDGNETAR